MDLNKWIAQNFWKFLFEYLFIFSLVNIFIFLKKRSYLFVNFIIFLILIALSIINRIKTNIQGEPLLFSDFKLIHEGMDIVVYFINNIKASQWVLITVVFIIIFIVILAAFFFIHNKEFKFFRNKIYNWTCSILCLLFFVTIININYSSLGKMGYSYIFWNNNENYNENGFIVGMLMSIDKSKIEEPRDYSEDSIKKIIDGTKIMSKENHIKPNIIFIQSEAFWDPTLINKNAFKKDPIPYFHKLQNKFDSGFIKSPVFGGKTVNLEFEVLTGIPTNTLPSGSVPYMQYINKPIQSIASILNLKGYKSTAIHSYHNWFYNRNSVYQFMGFDNFISSEFFNNPTMHGAYISDFSISNEIYNRIVETKERDFIYAVTMQNHGPYSDQGPTKGFEYVNNINQFSDEGINLLENYAEKLSYSDRALEQLLSRVEQLGEPTIVVFFGDHLPLLGSNYLVYKEANYLEGLNDYSTNEKMFNVPYVIWDNYIDNHRNDMSFNANLLSSYILNLINSDNLLTDLQFHVLEGNVSKEEMRDIELLQYDLIFGGNYSGLNSGINRDNYMLGRVNMRITNTFPTSIKSSELFNVINGESALSITGENFIKGSKIYLNDECQSNTSLSDNGVMSVLVDPKYFKDKGKLKIQVKLADSQGTILAESNSINIPITE